MNKTDVIQTTIFCAILWVVITSLLVYLVGEIVRIHNNTIKTIDEPDKKRVTPTIIVIPKNPINIYNSIPDEDPDIDISKEPEPEEDSDVKYYYDVPLTENLQDYIFALCENNNVDPALVIAMIGKESSYREDAIGDGGDSLGLMQIQPKWNFERMEKLECSDLLDPYQNVEVGIDILAELFATGKSTEWVLMAYNGGRSYANEKASLGIVSDYANTVIANSKTLNTYEVG